MRESSSDPRDALSSLLGCIQGTFKRYDRAARKKAWEALGKGKGKEEINRLLNNPNSQITGVPTFLKFKEWFYSS